MTKKTIYYRMNVAKEFWEFYRAALRVGKWKTVGITILFLLMCVDEYNAFSRGYGYVRSALETAGVVKPVERQFGNLKTVTVRIEGVRYKLVVVDEPN